MRNQINKADDFIANNIDKYGLLGSNVTLNPPSNDFYYMNGSCDFELTHNNYFQYGYYPNKFNWRKGSTCMYWTEYNLDESSLEAVPLILDRYKNIGILKPFSKFASYIKFMFEDIDVDIIDIDFKKEYDSILEFAKSFAVIARPRTAFSVLYAYAAEKYDGVFVYPSQPISVVNMNYSTATSYNYTPYWLLDDNEDDTVINRWIHFKNKFNIPNVYRYTSKTFIRNLNKLQTREKDELYINDMELLKTITQYISNRGKNWETFYTPIYRLINGLDYIKAPEIYGYVL